MDNLTAKEFTVLDQRSPQTITAFEPQSNEVSCVLLLDTTGSMQFALPALKKAQGAIVNIASKTAVTGPL